MTPPSLEQCRILICNDDGIASPGLSLLQDAARGLARDVWVVAPSSNQSSRSRAYTTGKPVTGRRYADRSFTVDGTPVDCLILGLNGLIPGRRPDLVLSGVNQGSNLAEDIGASGTIGLCLEAADQGVPGIAFSQVGTYHASDGGTWTAARTFLPGMISTLFPLLGSDCPVLNVNFPQLSNADDCPGIAVAGAGRRPATILIERLDDAGEDRFTFLYDEIREDRSAITGGDMDLALRGYITVTPLLRDLTNLNQLDRLRDRLSGA